MEVANKNGFWRKGFKFEPAKFYVNKNNKLELVDGYAGTIKVGNDAIDIGWHDSGDKDSPYYISELATGRILLQPYDLSLDLNWFAYNNVAEKRDKYFGDLKEKIAQKYARKDYGYVPTTISNLVNEKKKALPTTKSVKLSQPKMTNARLSKMSRGI